VTPGRAWALLAAFVIVYNLTSEEGGTLSEHADGWITRHPVLARAGILLVAAHVANLLNPRWDPIHRFFAGTRAHKAGDRQ